MQANKNRHNFSSLLLILTIFSFGLVFLRFSQIMVQGEINGENLEENVERLYTSNYTLQANRGTIFDRFGNPIAIDATSYKMLGVLTDKWSSEENPQHIIEKEKIADILSEHINLSKNEVLSFLNKEVDQVEFGSAGNNLSYQVVDKIKKDLEKEELTGVIFEEKKKRLYPNGTFASHTVGLAQYLDLENEENQEGNNEKQLVGVMGLEDSFNDVLTGENGKKTYKKDSFGYLIPKLDHEEVAPKDGSDIYLTLDHKLQAHLETILDKVQAENNPKAITATVLSPENGEIIASAQRPSFNATTLENIDQTWQNLLTEYTFEPGSTMKMLTLAAAIEEGVFQPNNYFKSGTVNLYGGTVRDHRPSGWGWISQLEGVARSSNVLFVKLVDDMGHDVWKDYLDAFGFGEKTGMDLPNEQVGNNPYAWPLQKVNTGFGQGISVTPIQMLQAFTSIANDGEMIRPKFVGKSVDNETGEEKLRDTVTIDTLISKETAQKTLDYLKQATKMENAVATNYRREEQDVAAKTGTAQLVDPETGKYSTNKYVHSVVSILPADDPEYIIYITVQEPTFTADAPSGSQVVQKIYHPLIDRVFDFTEAVNDENEEGDSLHYVEALSFLEMSTEEAIQSLDELGYDYTMIGNGDEIVQQYPYPDTPLFIDQQIILMTNGVATIPDLTGWSRNDVLKISELTGVKMKFVGEGYVINQDLTEGSYMEPESEITITLSSEDTSETEEEDIEEESVEE